MVLCVGCEIVDPDDCDGLASLVCPGCGAAWCNACAEYVSIRQSYLPDFDGHICTRCRMELEPVRTAELTEAEQEQANEWAAMEWEKRPLYRD